MPEKRWKRQKNHGLIARGRVDRRGAPWGSRVLAGEKKRGRLRPRARERAVAAPRTTASSSLVAFRPSRTDTNPDTRAKKPQRAAVRPRPRHARVPHPANHPTERRARARSRASTDARRTTFNVCGAQKHRHERDDNFFRLRFARAHPHQHAKRHALFFRLVVVARARDRHATPRRRERRARDFFPETRDVSL